MTQSLEALLYRSGAYAAKPGSLGAEALRWLRNEPFAGEECIWHVLTEWGTDELGVCQLAAFWFGADGSAWADLLRIARIWRPPDAETPRRLWWRKLGAAYMYGRRVGDRVKRADWTLLMCLPITDARRLLGIEEFGAR